MKSKGRYGQFVKWIFSMIDLLIVNLVFFASMYWQHDSLPADSELYSRPVWLVLNMAMLVGLYFYNDVHEPVGKVGEEHFELCVRSVKLLLPCRDAGLFCESDHP